MSAFSETSCRRTWQNDRGLNRGDAENRRETSMNSVKNPRVYFNFSGGCLAVLLLAGTAQSQTLSQNGASALYDAAQPYSADKLNPVSYAADCSIIVTPPYKTKVLKVWIPLPPSNGGQIVHANEFSTFPAEVQPQVDT